MTSTAMVLARALVAAVVVLALPAEARFGKSGSGSPRPSSHGAAPVNSGGRGGGHGGSDVPGPWIPGGLSSGYYSGFYVPAYGYGYGLYGPSVLFGMSPWLTPPEEVVPEQASLRITAGVQASMLVVGEAGVTFGLHGHLEGERWGLVLTGQNIAVKAQDGSGAMDNLQQAQARLTYAFLTGRSGRLRAELGADVIFAPSIITVGPSGALAGTLWLVGPLALEGSVLVTPYPFWQFDAQLGLALGLGPVGLRAGWRTQILDDRGLADGVVHRDTFMGPYVGVAVVF